MNDTIIAVVLYSVGMPRGVPVVMRQEVVTEDAYIPDGQGEPLPPGRVAGCSRIPDEDHTVLIWVVHPDLCAIKGRQRPNGACPPIPLRWCIGLDRFFHEPGQGGCPAQPRGD